MKTTTANAESAIYDRLIQCRLATSEEIACHDGLVSIDTGDDRWPSLSIRVYDNHAEFYFADDTLRSDRLFQCRADDLKKIVSFVSGVLAFKRA